jgi:hypothetical protein
MLIVRSANVCPSVGQLPRAACYRHIQVDGPESTVQHPVLIRVEYEQESNLDALKKEIKGRIRNELNVASHVDLVESGPNVWSSTGQCVIENVTRR